MKLNKLLYGALTALIAGSSFTACTDTITFGNAALEKPASSTANIDSVFQNAEYTRQFLVGIYSKQYYGLPYSNAGTAAPHSGNPYAGKFDALTDCWHMGWNGAAVYGQYYTGALTSYITRGDGLDGPLYSFDKEYQWWTMRAVNIFLENVDRAPAELSEAEKARLKAEARCLLVSAFFETFQHYGGIPIIDHALEASEISAQFPRRTVEECVNFMIEQLDLAIAEPNFPWVTSDPATMTGRWTRAGARALKAKILQFAASPLLNPKDGNPYYEGVSEEVKPYIMYTDASKYQERWDNFYTACKEFFNDLNNNGYYELTQAEEPTVPAYRLAYRKGYFLQESKEILHSVRVMGTDNFATARYCWHSWYTTSVPRNAYWPTQEYVEKFSWSDGEPFNWDNAWNKTFDADGNYIRTTVGKKKVVKMTNKSLHGMFMYGEVATGDLQITPTLSRDARLYEEVLVNGVKKNLNWTTAAMSGDTWELWVGGTDGLTGVTTQTNTMFGTGYGYNKYHLGDGTTGTSSTADNLRYQTQWVSLSLSDMYLTYAEALIMKSSPDYNAAVDQINKVRSRVGLPSFEDIWKLPTFREAAGYNASDKFSAGTTVFKTINGVVISEFMEELLNERVRELGLTNARWFDMVRLKRTDWMTTQLHALQMHRRRQNAEGEWVDYDIQWANGDKISDGTTQPWTFSYARVPITGNKRILWGKDSQSNEVKKWLFDPLPLAEINKGYGLVQNPGWE